MLRVIKAVLFVKMMKRAFPVAFLTFFNLVNIAH